MLSLRVESWIWYSFAIFITICRFVSRSLLFGSVKKLLIDDYLMVFAICAYTTLVVSMNIVANVQTNLLEPGFDMSSLTPTDIQHRVYGSKIVIVVEQMQCVSIWTLKATLLFMYYRLTVGLKENIVLICLAVYICISFIVMEILYLGVWCRPFRNYWAVPTPNLQCNTALNHLITNAVFNISSDLIMLGIALSLFAKSRLPWKRRAILLCIFSLGIFVIICAALNKYYSFTQPFGSNWTFWYIRECSTAVIIANLPFTWTLLRRIFKLSAFEHPTETSDIRYHSSRSARGRMSRPDHQNLASNRHSGSNQMGSKQNSHHSSIEGKKKIQSLRASTENQKIPDIHISTSGRASPEMPRIQAPRPVSSRSAGVQPESGWKEHHHHHHHHHHWHLLPYHHHRENSGGRSSPTPSLEPWDRVHEWSALEKAMLAEPVKADQDEEAQESSHGVTR